MTAPSGAILWLKTITKEDEYSFGKKATQLGDMLESGFPIPDGFVVSSLAYFQFLQEGKLIPKINQLLETINYDHPESVMQVAKHIQKLIMSTKMPESFIADFAKAYHKLSGVFTNAVVVMDIAPTHSTTSSLYQTISNVHGEAIILLKIKEAWATLFTPVALINRHTHHMNHFQEGIAVTLQKAVNHEKSGILLTSDPVSHDKTKLIIEVISHLTDHYVIDKASSEPKIIEKNVAGEHQQISDKQILDLALLGKKLEKQYYFPQEIQWVIEKDALYIVGTKPLHLTSIAENLSPIATKLPLLLRGIPASRGIATGKVRRVENTHDIEKIMHGDIVIATDIAIQHTSFLKKAAAFVTDQGGRTSSIAMLAREWGIPAVVGTGHVTTNAHTGQILTVDGTKGEIYRGSPTQQINPKNDTHIYQLLYDLDSSENTMHEHSDGSLIMQKAKPQKLDVKLAEICKNTHPHPVIYCFADTSGTYNLLHHPEEFKKELEIIKDIQSNSHCTNLSVMLPFVHSVHELSAAKHLMSEFGLTRLAHFKLWMEVATPGNIILLNEFIQTGIDGIAINIDTLTTHILGIDKNSDETAHGFDATNQAVLQTLESAIKIARQHGIMTTIFGQSLLHHSSLIEKLISWKITSITIDTNHIHQIKTSIVEHERRLLDTHY